MPLTNPNKVVTEERLNEYHRTILPYLGGNSMVACGGGYAPIGTVISYMGTRAPSDFLICDGTVYNIADYTELADFFEAQFGSSNFFGGDGNTTFAVPDLRGEFLRGTGTNSHANQGSGANVGVHQDGTRHTNAWSTDSIYLNKPSENVNHDNNIPSAGLRFTNGTSESGLTGDFSNFTSRPTNTSVLYCIKAKSQGNGYSLDEQIVGTWIDGKPLYQKVLIDATPLSGTKKTIDISSLNADYIIPITAWGRENAYNASSQLKIDYAAPSVIELAYDADWAKYRGVNGYVIVLQYTKTT